MSNYLYCIQYTVIDREVMYPEVIHTWFENDPEDKDIKEFISKKEKPFLNTVLKSFHYYKIYDKTKNISFVNEVEIFNDTFNKPNNYKPTISNKKEWEFVYNFILEELEEYREACEKGDIVGILDALCDITYVSLGNGVMLHGLKHKIWLAYQEVQASNMSKSCPTEIEAQQTVELRSKEQGEPCHYEEIEDVYVVYRTRDRKVMKSINYFKPNLTQFFTTEELEKCLPNNDPSTII